MNNKNASLSSPRISHPTFTISARCRPRAEVHVLASQCDARLRGIPREGKLVCFLYSSPRPHFIDSFYIVIIFFVTAVSLSLWHNPAGLPKFFPSGPDY